MTLYVWTDVQLLKPPGRHIRASYQDVFFVVQSDNLIDAIDKIKKTYFNTYLEDCPYDLINSEHTIVPYSEAYVGF